jgi:hypothetical protein
MKRKFYLATLAALSATAIGAIDKADKRVREFPGGIPSWVPDHRGPPR